MAVTNRPMTAPTPLSELSLGYLTITPAREGTELVLRMSGTADMRAMEALDGFLRAAHADALRHAVTEVAVDMRDLEFMNSSCFKAFVSWIESVVDLPEPKRYRIRLISNPQRLWQRRSLLALSCFATELIEVVS